MSFDARKAAREARRREERALGIAGREFSSDAERRYWAKVAADADEGDRQRASVGLPADGSAA